jgi:5'-nucleotidase
MPRILVTNDDGVHAEGIRLLADALRPFGDLTVVAPHQESSAIGHALTLRRPLRIDQLREGVYTVDGTPTDCVNIAITHILGAKPDLIVSGINSGWNIGDDVTYSGTVSGALEGALMMIPSIAVSAERRRNVIDYAPGVDAAVHAVEAVLAKGLPKFTFLNINVPAGPVRGTRVTVQARRNHVTVIDKRIDPRGGAYYWIEEGQNEWEPHDRSDYQAVRDGYVSVTPLQPDMTDHESLAYVEDLLG